MVAGPYIGQRHEEKNGRARHEHDIKYHDDPFAVPRLKVALTGETIVTPLLFLPAKIAFGATGGSRRVNIFVIRRSAVMRIRCFGFFLDLIASRVN